MGFVLLFTTSPLLAPLGWVHDLAQRECSGRWMRYDESNEIFMMIVCFAFVWLGNVKCGRDCFVGSVVGLG